MVESPVDVTDGLVLGDLVGSGDDIFVGNRDGLVLNPYNLVVSEGDSVGISSRILGLFDEIPLSEVIWVWGKEDIVLSLMVGEVVALGVGVEDSVTRKKVFFSSFLPWDALLWVPRRKIFDSSLVKGIALVSVPPSGDPDDDFLLELPLDLSAGDSKVSAFLFPAGASACAQRQLEFGVSQRNHSAIPTSVKIFMVR